MTTRVERETEGASDCRTVAVIPAYNEERFIGSVVLSARRYADRVIVVDDGSSDATAEAAGALVVRHGENRGKGVALNTGFRLASELCPEAVVMLDADGQHRPDEIRQVLGPVLAGEADIAVGSRYLEAGNAIPAHRVWGHRVFASLTKVLTGVRVTDSQCGFRAFSRAAVNNLPDAGTVYAGQTLVIRRYVPPPLPTQVQTQGQPTPESTAGITPSPSPTPPPPRPPAEPVPPPR